MFSICMYREEGERRRGNVRRILLKDKMEGCVLAREDFLFDALHEKLNLKKLQKKRNNSDVQQQQNVNKRLIIPHIKP